VTPGVAAYEGLFAQSGQKPTAALDLLAVSDGKIGHEEIYLDTSGSRAASPVTQWPSAPTAADTVARTTKTAMAFADAATGNTLKIGLLLADDVLFYDTAQKRERHGATALLRWWSGRTAWTPANRPQDGLVVGRGWAAIRWTATGGQASTDDITMPSATVLEIRSGKVVRMTLYYDSATLQLHL
jgi:ketosteroid isomerase-like protein